MKLFGKNPRWEGKGVSLGQSFRFPVCSLSPLLEEQDAGSYPMPLSRYNGLYPSETITPTNNAIFAKFPCPWYFVTAAEKQLRQHRTQKVCFTSKYIEINLKVQTHKSKFSHRLLPSASLEILTWGKRLSAHLYTVPSSTLVSL